MLYPFWWQEVCVLRALEFKSDDLVGLFGSNIEEIWQTWIPKKEFVSRNAFPGGIR